MKPRSFDTESHSNSNTSHPSKFSFSSPLEKDTEVIQNSLEYANAKGFQKSAQTAHTKSNPSLCDAKDCSTDLIRDPAENNREHFSSLHFIHLNQFQDASPLL